MPISCKVALKWRHWTCRASCCGVRSGIFWVGNAAATSAISTFLQGETPEEIAADAAHAAAMGEPVIYLKVGGGTEHDRQAVRLVRQAIGEARLLLDANEAWDPATTLRRMAEFAPYGIEYIEQPTTSRSIEALRRVTERAPIAIGADQAVFTLDEVHRTCATGAADMIAVGPREIGGLRGTMKAAAIAEGAGLNICIHSSMTTGITTCAEHHVARAIPNLDDGNQFMWQLLREDIVERPGLTPKKGPTFFGRQARFGVCLERRCGGACCRIVPQA